MILGRQKSGDFNVFRFMFSPEIGKRVRYLGFVFARFFHFFTITLGQIGLINPKHPCMLEANIGRYRIRDVLALAYSKLEWKREKMPQIVMFGAVVMAFALTVCMIIITLVQIGFGLGSKAHAQDLVNPTDYSVGGTSITVNPDDDLVNNMLSRIFGETGLDFFAWSIDKATWIHESLNAMLIIYSTAMAVVAALIILYYITSVLFETSKEGVPFGQRFDTVWAPIRFVVALGLLFPVSGGYNTAQLIVFQAAHWGSAFASNIWLKGLSTYADGQDMVGAPRLDTGADFVRGYWLIANCVSAWNDYVQKDTGTDTCTHECMAVSINQELRGVVYRFGNKVAPDFCGAIRVPSISGIVTVGGAEINAGGRVIQAAYQNAFASLSGGMTKGGTNDLSTVADGVDGSLNEEMNLTRSSRDFDYNTDDITGPAMPNLSVPGGDSVLEAAEQFGAFYFPGSTRFNEETVLTSTYFNRGEGVASAPNQLQVKWLLDNYIGNIEPALPTAIQLQQDAGVTLLSSAGERGWGQAGSFLLAIAALNEKMNGAVANSPSIVKTPDLLSDPDAQPEAGSWLGKLLNDFLDIFRSNVDKENAGQHTVNVLYKAKDWWCKEAQTKDFADAPGFDYYNTIKVTCDNDADELRKIKSSSDATSFLRTIDLENIIQGFFYDDLQPMAGLISRGSQLMITAKILIAVGIVAAIASWGWAGIVWTFAGAFLTAAVILYIVLPVLPFVYFTFSVITWATGIFEAIIAMPLWALSFLNIERGGGLFPSSSKNGLWIIFQIFLRPALMIISIIGALLVFSGAVGFLNDTFGPLANAVLTNTNPVGRGLMGIGLILAYSAIAYSLAIMCFKMVDTVPNSIIDYLGVGSPSPLTDIAARTGAKGKTMEGIFAFASISGNAGGGIEGMAESKHAKNQEKAEKEKVQRGMEGAYRQGKQEAARTYFEMNTSIFGAERARQMQREYEARSNYRGFGSNFVFSEDYEKNRKHFSGSQTNPDEENDRPTTIDVDYEEIESKTNRPDKKDKPPRDDE